jgi:hypothetical protein
MNDEAGERRAFEAWVAEVGSMEYGSREEWVAYRRGRADQRRADEALLRGCEQHMAHALALLRDLRARLGKETAPE